MLSRKDKMMVGIVFKVIKLGSRPPHPHLSGEYMLCKVPRKDWECWVVGSQPNLALIRPSHQIQFGELCRYHIIERPAVGLIQTRQLRHLLPGTPGNSRVRWYSPPPRVFRSNLSTKAGSWKMLLDGHWTPDEVLRAMTWKLSATWHRLLQNRGPDEGSFSKITTFSPAINTWAQAVPSGYGSVHAP